MASSLRCSPTCEMALLENRQMAKDKDSKRFFIIRVSQWLDYIPKLQVESLVIDGLYRVVGLVVDEHIGAVLESPVSYALEFQWCLYRLAGHTP